MSQPMLQQWKVKKPELQTYQGYLRESIIYLLLLNLAVSDAVKNNEIMKEALEKTHEKRNAKLDAIKNETKINSNSEEDHTEAITLLCPTHWAVSAKSLSSIMNNYSYLNEL